MTIIFIGHTSKIGQLSTDSLFSFPSFKTIYELMYHVEPETNIPSTSHTYTIHGVYIYKIKIKINLFL